MEIKGLESEIVKKIKTTMIGSISDIEEFFSYLWEGEPTKEKEDIKEAFRNVRDSILDRGNKQIRSIKKEIAEYNISRKVYKYSFKVKERYEEGNNG